MLEILDHVVDSCDALALRRWMAFEELAKHPLRSILDIKRHEREQIDDAQDLVLIVTRQTLDGPHEFHYVL
jgi:hypothetical protein